MAIQTHFRTLGLVAGFAATTLSGQPVSPREGPASAVAASHRWTITTPDASLAWFALLADLRLPGAGAFAFVAPSSVRATSPLALAVAQSRDFEILHFVPLYYPTADRTALVTALRAAATTPAVTPVPRAQLLVAALSNALAPDVRRDRLPELAAALERMPVVVPAAGQVAHWQQRLDSVYGPALAPWLREERLDGGRLIVSPAIGAEGRLFAGTTDRVDNIIAVGASINDADADAPLLAFVRELCFPAVTRAAANVRGFDAANPRSARRTSIAAVRCGAQLLDRLLPARADAYRAFWLRAAAPGSTHFDTAFPSDAELEPALTAAVKRVAAHGP